MKYKIYDKKNNDGNAIEITGDSIMDAAERYAEHLEECDPGSFIDDDFFTIIVEGEDRIRKKVRVSAFQPEICFNAIVIEEII